MARLRIFPTTLNDAETVMNTTQPDAEPLASTVPTTGHDANGRFTPGNAGGPAILSPGAWPNCAK